MYSGRRRLASCFQGLRRRVQQDRHHAQEPRIRPPAATESCSLSSQRRCLHAQRIWRSSNSRDPGTTGSFRIQRHCNYFSYHSSCSDLLGRTPPITFIGEQRAFHDACAVDHSEDFQRRRFYQSTFIRCFVSSKPPPSSEPDQDRSIRADKAGGATAPDSGEPPPRVSSDASSSTIHKPGAFADYLSETIKAPKALSGLPKTLIVDEEASAVNRKRRQRLIAPEKNKDLYQQIVEMQNLQKEASRKKTAYNVYRALLGNVVICSGVSRLYSACLLLSIFSFCAVISHLFFHPHSQIWSLDVVGKQCVVGRIHPQCC